MAVGDAHVFPGILTPVLTQLFFPKPPTTFLAYFCRGERRKYAGKKSRLNRGSNSQPPGHESDALTTEPPGWGYSGVRTLQKNHYDDKEFYEIVTTYTKLVNFYLLFLLVVNKVAYSHVRQTNPGTN